MPSELFFDIETKKLFQDIDTVNPSDLGVSIVSVYKRTIDENNVETSGEMLSFWEADLAKMWPLFTNADRVIGYNSLKFDVPALSPLCSFDFKKIHHFDVMDKIKEKLGFRIGLGNVALHTVGHTKTDVGTNAVLYYLQNTPESLAKLKEYCEADVAVLRDVYDFVLKNKYVKFKDKWNTIRVVEVDFSYPVTSQTSLF